MGSHRPGQRPDGDPLAWQEVATGLDRVLSGEEGNSSPSHKHWQSREGCSALRDPRIHLAQCLPRPRPGLAPPPLPPLALGGLWAPLTLGRFMGQMPPCSSHPLPGHLDESCFPLLRRKQVAPRSGHLGHSRQLGLRKAFSDRETPHLEVGEGVPWLALSAVHSPHLVTRGSLLLCLRGLAQGKSDGGSK